VPKLTKRIVDGLRPDPRRELFAWDNEFRGFGVKLRPDGVGSYIVPGNRVNPIGHRFDPGVTPP
jgi:hypothetical protein